MAGQGVNTWLWPAACALRQYDESFSVRLIRQAVANCGRIVTDQEITRAVRRARGKQASNGPSYRWPKPIPTRIAEIAARGPTLDVLQSKSRIASPTTSEVIHALFPRENELICLATDVKHALTRAKHSFGDAFANYQFIVPSPMSALRGLNQDGHVSQRSLQNVGPRRFLVVESDPKKWPQLSAEEQALYGSEVCYIQRKKDDAASVLWHLRQWASLTLVVDSGNRSLHGWFFVEGWALEKLVSFFYRARLLGADKATWMQVQPVRMPGAIRRDNGKVQRIIYFDPFVLPWTKPPTPSTDV